MQTENGLGKLSNKSALRKTLELGIGLTAISVLLVGCLGGSKGTAVGAAPGAGGVAIAVAPVLGQFGNGATVRIKDCHLTQVAQVAVAASGVANATVPTGTCTPLLIEAGVNGDTYFDEKLGTLATISGVASTDAALRALVPSFTANQQIGVTTLTDIAAGQFVNASGVAASALSVSGVVATNAAVGQAFGVPDVLTAPTLLKDTASMNNLGAITTADQYAAVLAGFAQAAPVGENAQMVARQARDDFSAMAQGTATTSGRDLAAWRTAINTAIATAPISTAARGVQVSAPAWTFVYTDLLNAAINAANSIQTNLGATLTQAELIAAMQAANLSGFTGFYQAANLTAASGAFTTAMTNVVAAWNPTITSFTPASGVAGTTSVTITGTGFDSFGPHNLTRFAGTPGTVTNTAPVTNQLTVLVPTGATTGRITVENITTRRFATSTTDFTVPGTTAAAPSAAVVAATAGSLATSGIWDLTVTGSITDTSVTPAVTQPQSVSSLGVPGSPTIPNAVALQTALDQTYGLGGAYTITRNTNTATRLVYTVQGTCTNAATCGTGYGTLTVTWTQVSAATGGGATITTQAACTAAGRVWDAGFNTCLNIQAGTTGTWNLSITGTITAAGMNVPFTAPPLQNVGTTVPNMTVIQGTAVGAYGTVANVTTTQTVNTATQQAFNIRFTGSAAGIPYNYNITYTYNKV